MELADGTRTILSGVARSRAMSTPVIRAMTSEDAPAAADLCDQLGYPVEPARLATRLGEVLAQGYASVRVAVLAGYVVGWIHVAVTPLLEMDRGAEILGLVVDRDHRGAGSGAALLADAERWARGEGCVAVRVRSRIVRDRAHLFYERNGYMRVKTQHAFEKTFG